ncbi:hypothetical protein [Achromobacter ruhlandii]|uniref:hypothetical protein n=1 Tax=Achromobacter ruhlandii TaxID=72557 RepID=UPI001EEDA5B3|nr:hypothetical protein [Achromobacter ruhlandii]
MPLANADGSAAALGARFTRGSPRACGAPCAAASSARQRKSRAGAADGADGKVADDPGVIAGMAVVGRGCAAGVDVAPGLAPGPAGRAAPDDGATGAAAGGADLDDAGDTRAAGGSDNPGPADDDAGADERAGALANDGDSRSTKSASRRASGGGPCGAGARQASQASATCRAQDSPAAHHAMARRRPTVGGIRAAPAPKESITTIPASKAPFYGFARCQSRCWREDL